MPEPDPGSRPVDDLLRALDDPEESERKSALLSLGRLKEPRAILPVRRMAASDESVELRFLAKKVLAYLASALGGPEPGHAPGVQATIDHADPTVRIQYLRRAAAAGAIGSLAAIVARAGAESDPAVRASVASALGALGGKPEIPQLDALAEDPDARVRANAIEALEAIGDPAAYPIFVRHVQDADNRIRANAIRALGKLGKANVAKLCLAMVRSRKAWMIESALFLLVPMKLPEAVRPLAELLSHPAPEIRAKARAGLDRLAESGSAEALAAVQSAPAEAARSEMDNVEALAWGETAGADQTGLDGATVEARLEALSEIEAAQDRDQIPALLQRLEIESEVKVRACLVRVLGRIGDRGIVPVLEARLTDKDGRVRANTVEAIAALVTDPEELTRSLSKVLFDVNNRAKTNAVLALWGKGSGGPVQALKELVASNDRNARISAIYAIHHIGEAAASLLTPLTRDGDAIVRERAVECRRLLGLEDDGSTPPPARLSGAHRLPKPPPRSLKDDDEARDLAERVDEADRDLAQVEGEGWGLPRPRTIRLVFTVLALAAVLKLVLSALLK